MQLQESNAQVVLHQFGRAHDCPNPSPFPIKLETWLRINKIKYINDFEAVSIRTEMRPNFGIVILNFETHYFQSQHLTTNKSPWATIDGEDVPDSQLVIERLAKVMDKDLEKDLDPKQKAVAHGLRIMLEDNLYWVLIMDR